jgi:hypothetical protein
MRTLGAPLTLAITAALTPAAANAGERVTDAALGAVAGAVAAGPVGFVGGGIIGYVAGPQIACDLGVNRCYRHARYRRSRYSAPDASAHSDRGDRIRGPGDLGTREDHGNY